MNCLKYVYEVKYAEVLGQWLRREYDNAKRGGQVPQGFEALIADSDYDDPIKNQQRLNLLYYRCPLLCALPIDTRWFKIEVAKEDLELLQVIKEVSWNVLSGGTGEIVIAARNFIRFSENPTEIPEIANPTVQKWFKDLVKALQTFRSQVDSSGLNLTLILIGTSKGGPFTILEGNKTAIGLYLKYFVDHPQLSYLVHSSYVGLSPAMSYCKWHHQS